MTSAIEIESHPLLEAATFRAILPGPLGTIDVPMDMITNCTFGGVDLKTLYITAGHTLWSTPVQTKGALHWPK